MTMTFVNVIGVFCILVLFSLKKVIIENLNICFKV